MECESDYCGSRSFQLGDDGFTYCSEGHRQSQSGLLRVEEDAAPPIGRTTLRQRQEETALTGKAGVEHYLVCFQTLLWTQVDTLVHQHGFPEALTGIVRDVWILNLSIIQKRIPAQEGSEETPTELFSSQGDTSDSDSQSSRRRRTTKETPLPRLIDGVCSLCIAVAILRLPIMLKDIFDLIQGGQLLYYRALHSIDPAMRQRLPGIYWEFLNPRNQLRLEVLETTFNDTVAHHASRHGLSIPPMNHHLILWRLLRELSLPIEVYTGTLRLAHMLDFDFSYSSFQEPSKRSSKIFATPERRLISLMIATTKLFYPFDSHDRPPRRATEPAALLMDWPAWVIIVKSRQAPATAFQRALDTTEDDILRMTDDQLDEYTAWFADTYTSDQPPLERRQRRPGHDADFLRALYKLFPVDVPTSSISGGKRDAGGTEGINGRIVNVQSKMKPVRVLPQTGIEEHIDRPGQQYRRYRTVVELGDGPAKVLFTEAARCCGFSVEAVVKGVFAVERRLDDMLAGKGKDA